MLRKCYVLKFATVGALVLLYLPKHTRGGRVRRGAKPETSLSHPFNTAVGNDSLGSNSSDNNNTVIGNLAASNVTTVDNVICIGAGVGGANVSNTCFIGNVQSVTTQNNDAIPVLIELYWSAWHGEFLATL